MMPEHVMQDPRVGGHAAVKRIAELGAAGCRGEAEGENVLVMMVPGAQDSFRNRHQQPVADQEPGLLKQK